MRFAAAALSLFALTASAAAEPFTLSDLAFLEGHWTSDRSGFVIEEMWTDAQAGVVVGSSRGVQNGAVRFLRFAVVQQTPEGVVMRFKRFNADYTTWETGGPSVMRLVEAGAGSTVFVAEDPKSDVQRIVYKSTPEGTIEVTANRVDEQGPYLVEFTLTRAD
jgi:hypothetical protein